MSVSRPSGALSIIDAIAGLPPRVAALVGLHFDVDAQNAPLPVLLIPGRGHFWFWAGEPV